jgi:Phosphotransferase enzyme family
VTTDKTGEAEALAAAQAVARQHGVACDEAVRIAAGSNVLVHLKPAPVVARVMTGTAVLHNDPERWLAREVAVGAFLAARTDMVVPLSDSLPPGPHEQDGLWMTLWKFVPHDEQAPPPEPRELGRSLRGLHAALADFAGDLAPLSEIRDWLERLLAELRPSPLLPREDIDWLCLRLEALTPSVFESSLPAQALHGDASMSNLLRTDSGLVWNDLEDVCTGPVAWDLAGLVTSASARGQSAQFLEELLAAYGEPGVEDLGPFLEAHGLYDIVWQAFEARRRPRSSRHSASLQMHKCAPTPGRNNPVPGAPGGAWRRPQ